MPSPIVVSLEVRFPWWAEIYLGLAILTRFVGIPVDGDKVAAFLVDHATFEVTP